MSFFIFMIPNLNSDSFSSSLDTKAFVCPCGISKQVFRQDLRYVRRTTNYQHVTSKNAFPWILSQPSPVCWKVKYHNGQIKNGIQWRGKSQQARVAMCKDGYVGEVLQAPSNRESLQHGIQASLLLIFFSFSFFQHKEQTKKVSKTNEWTKWKQGTTKRNINIMQWANMR